MLEENLLELAKVNVREAMRKEIKLNEELIETYNDLSRNSKREWKIEALTAIVRNETLKSFLSLDLEAQHPEKLRYDYPINDRFNRYVLQTSTTSYAQSIYYEAKRRLYLDYTHGHSQLRNRVFLDEPLPELPEPPQPPVPTFLSRVLNVVGNIIGYGFAYAYFGLILFAIIAGIFFSDDDSGNKSTTNYNPNTFNSGGVSGGNSSGKSVSNSPQVMDQSGQTGFGNGGTSGHDTASSGLDNSSSSEGISGLDGSEVNHEQALDSDEGETTPINELQVIGAHYFSPNSGGNEYFELRPDERNLTYIGEIINIDFEVPISKSTVITVNDVVAEGQATTNPDITWVQFTVAEGENVITIQVDNEIYTYYFDAN